MHVKALVPPTIHSKTFYEVNRKIPVYVPDEVVEDYKADPYWKEFLTDLSLTLVYSLKTLASEHVYLLCRKISLK